MSGKKNPSPIPLKSLDALFGTMDEEQTGIQQISLESLHMFEGHPFKVSDDDKMMELAESVSTHGVLVPGIVRIKDSGGYEIIAGHRRKRACEIAGLKTMPVIIKDLTDDESTVIMVDSNMGLLPTVRRKSGKVSAGGRNRISQWGRRNRPGRTGKYKYSSSKR